MKKIFISFALLCVASYGGYKMYNSYESVGEESFLLQNVEALADNTESVSVSPCFNEGWALSDGNSRNVYKCDERTSQNRLYSCPSNKRYITPGLSSYCLN